MACSTIAAALRSVLWPPARISMQVRFQPESLKRTRPQPFTTGDPAADFTILHQMLDGYDRSPIWESTIRIQSPNWIRHGFWQLKSLQGFVRIFARKPAPRCRWWPRGGFGSTVSGFSSAEANEAWDPCSCFIVNSPCLNFSLASCKHLQSTSSVGSSST